MSEPVKRYDVDIEFRQSKSLATNAYFFHAKEYAATKEVENASGRYVLHSDFKRTMAEKDEAHAVEFAALKARCEGMREALTNFCAG